MKYIACDPPDPARKGRLRFEPIWGLGDTAEEALDDGYRCGGGEALNVHEASDKLVRMYRCKSHPGKCSYDGAFWWFVNEWGVAQLRTERTIAPRATGC